LLLIALGTFSLLTQGLNYGIDFKGGNSWEVPAPHVSVGQARGALGPIGLGEAKIQKISGGTEKLRVEFRHLSPEKQDEVTQKLAGLAKVDASQVSKNDVGPSWGNAVTNKARTALIVFFVLISLYLSVRFEWKMALSAIVAVVHDILITVGIYSLSRFEVTPATVVAFLTILGYSLYDTVVVFDKIQENTRGLAAQGRVTYSETVNLSMNQVLMRSINTSFVAILPILSVLVIGSGVLGATSLKDFGLALLVGLLTGAYSSIFVASPVLAMLKERETRYATIRERVKTKGGMGPLTPAEAAVMSTGGTGGGGKRLRGPNRDEVLVPGGDGDGSARTATRTVAANRPRPGAPRPRKKGKKR
ncbi:MAG: protein translocase subunit SecF, partial [Actinomycetota bacterium]|nr:protein translocase subunit SecF [Actinomycetota bacterium]